MGLLRDWLEEKLANGVSQVRITTTLAKLAEEESLAQAPKRSRAQSLNGKVTVTRDDLLGAAEVAALLNVDRTRPSKWRIKRTKFGPEGILFPEPFVDLKTGPVWLRSQIEPMIPFVEERRRHRD